MPSLTSEQKGAIIALYRENLSSHQIATRIGCAQSTVVRLIQKYQQSGSTERRSGSGRPRATTQRQDRVIQRLSLSNRFKTAVDIRSEIEQELNVNVTARTVRNRLRDFGLQGRRSVEKLLLTNRNKQARRHWAESYRNWTDDHWNNVIFSDECKFNLHGSDGRLYVRRKVGERMAPSCQQLKQPKQRGLMVWGCFSGRGLGRLVFVSTTMNSAEYKNILEGNLLPSIQEMFAENEDFLFQQDNAPCHNARIVRDFLQNYGVDVMDWPSRSPDLNPIENIWSLMKYNIKRRHPKTIQDLENGIRAAWEEISEEIIKNLISSMQRRCAAVISSRGGPINY